MKNLSEEVKKELSEYYDLDNSNVIILEEAPHTNHLFCKRGKYADFYETSSHIHVFPKDDYMKLFDDKLYLPSHYTPVSQPYFQGKGNHNIKELENMLEQYHEYAHQQQIIKQKVIKKLINKIYNKNLE